MGPTTLVPGPTALVGRSPSGASWLHAHNARPPRRTRAERRFLPFQPVDLPFRTGRRRPPGQPARVRVRPRRRGPAGGPRRRRARSAGGRRVRRRRRRRRDGHRKCRRFLRLRGPQRPRDHACHTRGRRRWHPRGHQHRCDGAQPGRRGRGTGNPDARLRRPRPPRPQRSRAGTLRRVLRGAGPPGRRHASRPTDRRRRRRCVVLGRCPRVHRPRDDARRDGRADGRAHPRLSRHHRGQGGAAARPDGAR